MINALFVVITTIIVFILLYVSKLIIKIVTVLGLNKYFTNRPLFKSIFYMMILGILSTAFLFGISFPFTERTGFHTDYLDFTLFASGIYCVSILIILLVEIFLYKLIRKKAPHIPYSVMEDDFDYGIYYKVVSSKKNIIYWLIYRWLIPGIVKEILFRGIVISILDVAIKGYFDLIVFHLGFSVIIAQIIYHITHIKIHLRPFYIKISLLEQIRLILIGIPAGILYWYTGSLIGPIIMHCFYSGISAVLYLIVEDREKIIGGKKNAQK